MATLPGRWWPHWPTSSPAEGAWGRGRARHSCQGVPSGPGLDCGGRAAELGARPGLCRPDDVLQPVAAPKEGGSLVMADEFAGCEQPPGHLNWEGALRPCLMNLHGVAAWGMRSACWT